MFDWPAPASVYTNNDNLIDDLVRVWPADIGFLRKGTGGANQRRDRTQYLHCSHDRSSGIVYTYWAVRDGRFGSVAVVHHVITRTAANGHKQPFVTGDL